MTTAPDLLHLIKSRVARTKHPLDLITWGTVCWYFRYHTLYLRKLTHSMKNYVNLFSLLRRPLPFNVCNDCGNTPRHRQISPITRERVWWRLPQVYCSSSDKRWLGLVCCFLWVDYLRKIEEKGFFWGRFILDRVAPQWVAPQWITFWVRAGSRSVTQATNRWIDI